MKGKIKISTIFNEMHNNYCRKYVWGNLFNHESEEKIRDIIPIIQNERETKSFKLFMGNSTTGSHVHYHAPASNFLFYGSKLWWIFPKNDNNKIVLTKIGYSKNIPIKINVNSWLNIYSEYLKENIIDLCIINQNEGDVIIIPNNFYHLVINLEPCMGIVYSWEYGGEYLSLV